MWWGVQRLDGAERRLVDYFDLVAGTSAGGLITAMITSPSTQDATRPLFTAKEVFNFYQKYANKIFPQTKYTRSLPLSLSYQPTRIKPINSHSNIFLTHFLTDVVQRSALCKLGFVVAEEF